MRGDRRGSRCPQAVRDSPRPPDHPARPPPASRPSRLARADPWRGAASSSAFPAAAPGIVAPPRLLGSARAQRGSPPELAQRAAPTELRPSCPSRPACESGHRAVHQSPSGPRLPPELANGGHAPTEPFHDVEERPEQPLPVHLVGVLPDREVAVICRHGPARIGIRGDGVPGKRVMLEERLFSATQRKSLYPVGTTSPDVILKVEDAALVMSVGPNGEGRASGGGQVDIVTREDKIAERRPIGHPDVRAPPVTLLGGGYPQRSADSRSTASSSSRTRRTSGCSPGSASPRSAR